MRLNSNLAEWRASPNHKGKRKGTLAVITHDTEGAFKGAVEWLCNPKNPDKSSAHVVVSMEGQIVQLVELELVANHAGNSQWTFLGRTYKGLNNWTMGVELENPRSATTPYPECQMLAYAHLLVDGFFPPYPNLNINLVLAHSAVATPAGRRSDPGALFKWGLLGEMVAGLQRPAPWVVEMNAAVAWAEGAGLILGGKDTPVTRAALALIVWRFGGLLTTGKVVRLNRWETDMKVAGDWAKTTGLITGDSQTVIDRQSLATVLLRFDNLRKGLTSSGGAWQREMDAAMIWAQQGGIILGDPWGVVDRKALATVLNRYWRILNPGS